MLVLTRKQGQRILIGEDIAITIVALGRGKVRIGVDAPKDVTIVREELDPLAVPDLCLAHV